MHVEFAFHGTIREAAGRDHLRSEVSIPDDTTVRDALATVLREVPDAEPLVFDSEGTLRAHVTLRHDDEDVRSGGGIETSLEDDDRIDLEPSVKGAC